MYGYVSLESLANSFLEITVWHQDTLKENLFLGGVVVPLMRLLNNNNNDGQRKIEAKFKLEPILPARMP